MNVLPHLGLNVIGMTGTALPLYLDDTRIGYPALSLVSYTDTQIIVSWPAVSGAVSYRVYVNGVLFDAAGVSPETITGLAADTIYNITVKAVDAGGNGTASNTLTHKTAKVVVQTITTSGTWKAASISGFVGTTIRTIQCTGPGGAGDAGGGGGGGECSVTSNATIITSTDYDANVPASGDVTSFSDMCVAYQGLDGVDGGTGGYEDDGVGDVKHSGGNGELGIGGGGGGSASASADGGNASHATGGTGQASGGNGGVQGLPGGVPGGGGGSGGTGASGGRGEIRLTYLTD